MSILLLLLIGVELVCSQAIYVFGYASMMSQENWPSQNVLPARLSGLSRSFCVPGYVEVEEGEGFVNLAFQSNTVFLGLRYNQTGTTNGLLFKVTPQILAALDQEEFAAPGNARVQFYPSNFTILYQAGNIGQNDQIYSYLFTPNYLIPGANSTQLIIQSYVDRIVSGCINIDANYSSNTSFQDEFLTTTIGFDVNNWVNDRLLPRKPSFYQPAVKAIDAALLRAFGQTLNSIQLDSTVNPSLLANVSVYQQAIAALQQNITSLQLSITLLSTDDASAKAQIAQLQNLTQVQQAQIADLQSTVVFIREEAKFTFVIVICFLVALFLIIVGTIIYVWRNLSQFSHLSELVEKIPLQLRPSTGYGTA